MKSVVAVSDIPRRAELLNALLFDPNDCDVVVVESVACAYSRIKQVAPDLVILLLAIDDVASCQLLSMLTIDGDTRGIPIVTWATQSKAIALEEIAADLNQDPSLSEGLWT